MLHAEGCVDNLLTSTIKLHELANKLLTWYARSSVAVSNLTSTLQAKWIYSSSPPLCLKIKRKRKQQAASQLIQENTSCIFNTLSPSHLTFFSQPALSAFPFSPPPPTKQPCRIHLNPPLFPQPITLHRIAPPSVSTARSNSPSMATIPILAPMPSS